MKQSKYFSRWKPRYFKLEDGFLYYFDKKSLVGTNKYKVRYHSQYRLTEARVHGSQRVSFHLNVAV